jgi:hypothetical protein
MAETAQQPNSHGIPCDEQTLKIKQNIMERDKKSNLLNGISGISTFIAGVMIPIGMSTILPAVSAAAHLGFGAIMTAVGGCTVGLAFLGVAAVATVAAIAANYYGSHIYQSAGFDQVDFNAKATAKHLVAALKENNMCFTQEHEQNCRNDGKTWVQAMNREPAIAQVQ